MAAQAYWHDKAGSSQLYYSELNSSDERARHGQSFFGVVVCAGEEAVKMAKAGGGGAISRHWFSARLQWAPPSLSSKRSKGKVVAREDASVASSGAGAAVYVCFSALFCF